MTLPDERYRALRQVPDQLMNLAMKTGPIRHKEVRSLVKHLLRHYPMKYELAKIAKSCPELLKAVPDDD